MSGDIVTKGGWQSEYEFGDRKVTGLELAKIVLKDIADKLGVPGRKFCLVPGNHDIVREARADPTKVQDYLLHYGHEVGFRTLREEFCDIYKLSPLNFAVRLTCGQRTAALGLLNSAYLNEKIGFSEYGYVGDDADHVFSILASSFKPDTMRLLVLHHHLLPVYEREILGNDGKISLTLDSAKLLRQAQESGVCLILHGHEHATKQMSYASWSAEMNKSFKGLKHPLTIFAGGSSGAKASRLPTSETNAYAIIDISADRPTVKIRRIYSGGRRGEDW